MKPMARDWVRRCGPTMLFLVVVYGGVFLFFDCLRFETRKDERYYWPAVERFAREFPPTLELLRGYDLPSTPLAFVLFGGIERFTGGGIRLARLVNLGLSFTITMIVAWPRGGAGKRSLVRESVLASAPLRSILAALGLMLFPYYLGASVHFYTDILASFWVVTGTLAHLRGRHWVAAGLFALGIATRQYMVAFPAALAAHACLESMRGRQGTLKSAAINAFSASTLLGWFVFFGGWAPAAALLTHLAADQAGALHVDHCLYSLSCVGAFFVIPELLLFRGVRKFGRVGVRQASLIGGALLIAFVAWPPRGNDPATAVETMGYLDKALRAIAPEFGRLAILWLLAALAVVRFREWGIEEWLVLGNAAVLLRSHIAWDKYSLPLLAVLWLLKSRWGMPNGRFPSHQQLSRCDLRINL